MPFELAHFGAISAKICAAKEVVKAEPEDACKPLQGQHYDGKFVRVNIKNFILFFCISTIKYFYRYMSI